MSVLLSSICSVLSVFLISAKVAAIDEDATCRSLSGFAKYFPDEGKCIIFIEFPGEEGSMRPHNYSLATCEAKAPAGWTGYLAHVTDQQTVNLMSSMLSAEGWDPGDKFWIGGEEYQNGGVQWGDYEWVKGPQRTPVTASPSPLTFDGSQVAVGKGNCLSFTLSGPPKLFGSSCENKNWGAFCQFDVPSPAPICNCSVPSIPDCITDDAPPAFFTMKPEGTSIQGLVFLETAVPAATLGCGRQCRRHLCCTGFVYGPSLQWCQLVSSLVPNGTSNNVNATDSDQEIWAETP